jgi:mRNA interferase RelE/StbE
VDALKSNPKPHDSESLTGYPGWLRIDVGEYRVIYKVEGGEIFIAIIGSRNDDKVYREFRRLNIG